MRRKKWTEEEEAALIQEYSDLKASGSLFRLKTRERKFQPIADRVNALHNLRDPINFPFRWSWRDVSIKIQNMRHQYLGVKQKIRSPPGSGSFFDWSAGEHLWKNFVLYKKVFGDMDIESAPSVSTVEPNLDGDEGDNGDYEGRRFKLASRSGDGRFGRRLVELGEFLMSREERRRDRDGKKEEEREMEDQCEREKEHRREMKEIVEMQERRWKLKGEERDWWRRREQRWEEEEMEWRERLLGMQIEHEKHMMQMHLDTCQVQAQMLGFLVRLVSQFIGSSGGGDVGMGGISNQALHNLQQQQPPEHHHRQDDPASIGGENGKSNASSAGPYL